MAFIYPLDLETLWLSILAGSPFIFWILGIIFILIVAGFFRMPGGATILFLVLFTLGFSGVESADARVVGLIAVLLIGIAIYYAVKGIISK